MSQQHQQHLVNLRLLDSHQSVDDAINYRIQVLQAFGPEHELFAPGCVDLLNMLIDTGTLSKAMRAVQDDLSRRGGDNGSIEKVNACFSKALTTVLARAGLAATESTATSKQLSSLHPRAPPYAAASPLSLATTGGSRTMTTTVPALSLTNTTSDKPRSGVAIPTPARQTIATGWGRKNIRLSRIPPWVTLHDVTMGVDKYSGNMISYSPRTGEAIVSFPVVTAADMLPQGSVVIGDHVCSADDKIAPLVENVVKTADDNNLMWNEPAETTQANGGINGVKQQLEDLAISASKKEVEEVKASNKSTAAKTEWNDLTSNANQKENEAFETASRKPETADEVTFAQPAGPTDGNTFPGADDANKTIETESSLPVSSSSPAAVSAGLDSISFTNWKKGFKRPDFSKYRREQPAPGPEQIATDVTNGADDSFAGAGDRDASAPAVAVGGWDGAASPTYLVERGLMLALPDIEDNAVPFSITGTFPFNTSGVANGLSSRFGEDALALYSVPIEREKFGGFNFEKTITYYAKFRQSCAPAFESQEICLEPKSGDGGQGWYVKLDPVEAVGANAYMVRDQPSLVGYVDY